MIGRLHPRAGRTRRIIRSKGSWIDEPRMASCRNRRRDSPGACGLHQSLRSHPARRWRRVDRRRHRSGDRRAGGRRPRGGGWRADRRRGGRRGRRGHHSTAAATELCSTAADLRSAASAAIRLLLQQLNRPGGLEHRGDASIAPVPRGFERRRKPMVRQFSEDDVRRVLTVKDASRVVEQAFRDRAAARPSAPPVRAAARAWACFTSWTPARGRATPGPGYRMGSKGLSALGGGSRGQRGCESIGFLDASK